MGVRDSGRRCIDRGGRRYSICGVRRRIRARVDRRADRRAGAIVACLSGFTLVIVLSLSVYAVARPPAIPHAATVQRFSVADFLSAVR